MREGYKENQMLKIEEYIDIRFSDFKITRELSANSAARVFVLCNSHDKSECVLKICNAEGVDNGIEKLKSEIQFILNLPKPVKKFFPRILDSFVDKRIVWYLMPCYEDYLSINDYLCNDYLEPSLLYKIMDYLFENFYTDSKIHHTNIIDENWHRIQKRYHKGHSNDKLQNLFYSEEILVNGERLLGVDTTFEKIKNLYSEELVHEEISIIHKDLALGNILIQPDNNDFILIDPRGGEAVYNGNYFYDLGKFLYSLTGFYAILGNEYVLVENADNIHFKLIGESGNSFNTLKKDFMTYLNHNQRFLEDNWEIKLLFYEACHFIAVAPCFEDMRRVAFFLHGLVKLNEILKI